jgi:hypothetical protein
MMSSVFHINSYLTIPIRNKIQKVIPYVAVIIGLLFILRGLGLGIPYVSPSNMSLLFKKIHNVINTIFNNFKINKMERHDLLHEFLGTMIEFIN